MGLLFIIIVEKKYKSNYSLKLITLYVFGLYGLWERKKLTYSIILA